LPDNGGKPKKVYWKPIFIVGSYLKRCVSILLIAWDKRTGVVESGERFGMIVLKGVV
jgi:hypothetical protein